VLAVVAFQSCKTSGSLTSTNLASQYKKDLATLKPEYKLYHVSDTTSQLYFKVNAGDLTYAELSKTLPREAAVSFHYNLYDSYEGGQLLDSATVTLGGLEQSESPEMLIGDITLKAKSDRNYLLEVTATDVYRKRSVSEFIVVRKADLLSRQNFLLTYEDTELPTFSYYLDANRPIRIQHRSPIKKTLSVRYYDRNFALAPPPFSMYSPKPFQYEADSLFAMEPDGEGWLFTAKKAGFYHLLINAESKTGLTLFRFGGNFPGLKNMDELIEPLRFITSKKEFMDIEDAADQKQALDAFWLDNTINPDRARELIKQFYTRVENANRYFSTHKPGWKTDRGMVYMIFGAPNVTYRSSSSESWIYGEENNFMSLTFNFSRVNNPFSGNDYMLNRSPVYKNAWYRAVDSWRQGRVFSN